MLFYTEATMHILHVSRSFAFSKPPRDLRDLMITWGSITTETLPELLNVTSVVPHVPVRVIAVTGVIARSHQVWYLLNREESRGVIHGAQEVSYPGYITHETPSPSFPSS